MVQKVPAFVLGVMNVPLSQDVNTFAGCENPPGGVTGHLQWIEGVNTARVAPAGSHVWGQPLLRGLKAQQAPLGRCVAHGSC